VFDTSGKTLAEWHRPKSLVQPARSIPLRAFLLGVTSANAGGSLDDVSEFLERERFPDHRQAAAPGFATG